LIKEKTWVEIEKTVLFSHERAPKLPLETREKDLIMRVKGFLLKESKLGEKVKIKTTTGRIEEGILVEVRPFFKHSYGEHVSELDLIGINLKNILFGEDYEL